MDPIIVGLVLVAAVLHVIWNVLLKTSGDPLLTAFVGMAGAALVAMPVGLLLVALAPPDPMATDARPALALAVGSGLVEAVYFVLLSRAYRHGDLSVVYPTARGTAPLVAVAIGVVVLGERLTPPGAIGVAALLVGIVLLQRPWRLLVGSGLDPAARTASIAALATGVMVALYSAIDRVAVRTVDPAVYAALLWPAMVGWIGLALLVSNRSRGHRGLGVGPTVRVSAATAGSASMPGSPTVLLAAPTTAPATAAAAPSASSALVGASTGVDLRRAIVGGLLTYAAYLLVLFALSVAPLTAVTPLRESAVVLAAAWGALRLREAIDRVDLARRMAAAGLVVVGIVLLVFEGS